MLASVLLSAGLNRLLGTETVFDPASGIVLVNRTLADRALFRRRFPMHSIARVFNDRRSYIGPMNQRLVACRRVTMTRMRAPCIGAYRDKHSA
jgi:hypothetical protein